MDYESVLSESPDNIIIYGHNMKNANMFSDLLNFRDESYFKENTEIILYTETGTMTYEILASLPMDLTSKENFFQFNSYIKVSEEMNSMDYINEIKARALYFKDGNINPSSKLITLSTCAYDSDNARFLIVGVEK